MKLFLITHVKNSYFVGNIQFKTLKMTYMYAQQKFEL